MSEQLAFNEPAPTTPAAAEAGDIEQIIEAALVGPLRRVVLLVAYDGTAFRGFAVQPEPGLPTVGGALVAALTRMIGGPGPDPVAALKVTCAGRTDAGVHALGQVVHVDLPAAVVDKWVARAEAAAEADATDAGERGELPRLAKSLTNQCGPALAVARAFVAPEGFDARRSAIARRYRYDILRTRSPGPLARLTTWHVPGELDLRAMRLAADTFLGSHDFSAFCKRPPDHLGPITRRVTDTRLSSIEDPPRLRFEIEANAFCHHMVRSIVATIVGVGQGSLTAADLVSALRTGSASKERAHGGQMARPEGLCLELVRYPLDLVPGGVITA